jgi:hypothetical protein
MGIAEGLVDPEKDLHLSRFLKAQSSPVFDLLATKWEEVG